MALRTNETDVADTVETNCDIDLGAFLEVANVMTDKIASCATDRGQTLTTSQLEMIERYLAAHFYSLRDPEYKQKKTGDASASFFGQDGKGLEGTRFGQAAMTLDTSGCLRSFDQGTFADMTWLGKPKSDQIDYEDRD